MNDALRRNGLTLCMLGASAALYFLLFAAGHGSQPSGGLGAAGRQTRYMTKQEIHQKEEALKKNLLARPRLLAVLGMAMLAGILSAIVYDVILFIREVKGRHFFDWRLPQIAVSWGKADVFQVIVFAFFSEACLMALESLFLFSTDFRKQHREMLVMTNSLLRDGLVVLFVLALVRRKFQAPLASIGLSAQHFFTAVKTGIKAYFAVIPLLAASLILLALAAQVFSYEPEPQDVVQIYLKSSGGKTWIFFTFFVAVLGPAMEEIFFRGFAYRAFRTRCGVWPAILISSAIFSLLHMNLIAALPIFLLGIFLTVLAEKTGSLVPSMAAHMTHNLMMVAFTLLFKMLSV